MAELNFSSSDRKTEVFDKIRAYMGSLGFNVKEEDQTRPWGGFFVLEEMEVPRFRQNFFKEVKLTDEQLALKLSPKILVVAPKQRLSWQYHHRRAEIWKLIFGEGRISTSPSDEQSHPVDLIMDQVISLEKGERHRLIGGDNWGVVAEIWMHTDPDNPSNEDDIVRVSDDYSRT